MKLKRNLQKPPTDKRRKNRQKAARLAREELRAQIGQERKRLRSDVPITMIRRGDELFIGVRKGLFGHPGTVLLKVDEPSIVGMVEDRAELAKFINNLGILAASQLFKHNLAEGLDGLAKTIAKWAGIDLEALRKAAEEEASETAPALYICPKCQAQWPSAEAMAEHLASHPTEEEAPVL